MMDRQNHKNNAYKEDRPADIPAIMIGDKAKLAVAIFPQQKYARPQQKP